MCMVFTQKPSSLNQLRITFSGLRSPVWRCVTVSGSIRLCRLHDVLQIAMDQADSHLDWFENGLET